MNRQRLILGWLLLLALALNANARPGILTTRNGTSVNGDVTLSPAGSWLVTAGSSGTPVGWADFKRVRFETESPATNLPQWRVVFRHGSVLAVDLPEADDTSINAVSIGQKRKLRLSDIAALWEKSSPALYPTNRVGAVLRNGDFLEGDFVGIDRKQVKINTILFGQRRLALSKEVTGVILHPLNPVAPRYETRTVGGAVYFTQAAPTGAPDEWLILNDLVLGQVRLALAEIVEIVSVPVPDAPPIPPAPTQPRN